MKFLTGYLTDKGKNQLMFLFVVAGPLEVVGFGLVEFLCLCHDDLTFQGIPTF